MEIGVLRRRVGSPVSQEFINIIFKSGAVGDIPPLRMNLCVHRDLARNNAGTHSVLTSLPAQVSSSEFFLKVPGRNVSAVANIFLCSLKTYFYLYILILISTPQPFSSTQRTSFESLLLLLNSLAH